MPVPKAQVTETEHGAVVESEGWYVVNVADAQWERNEAFGTWCGFEGENAPFPEFGINIHVVQPGQPNGLYHGEDAQESFLVLAGECICVIEGQERRLRAWDFVHCPPGTDHIFIGAGEGPCAILMAGTRKPGRAIHYPVEKAAARHGAAVAEPTDSPREAYADFPSEVAPVRGTWPPAD
jgi:uncharacterized cupin superfamily protein